MSILQRAPGKGPDEISTILGTPVYAERHYDRGLTEQLLGKHSTNLVPVSRFYLRLTPPVVVDFEPVPGDGRFWSDEKRAYFNARGIVYVPIYLQDRLTAEDFKSRVQVETETMQETRRAMDVYPGETVDPDILSAARAEAFRQCEALVEAKTLAKPSAAYSSKLTALTRALIAELTAQESDGRLGSDLRAHDAPVAAR